MKLSQQVSNFDGSLLYFLFVGERGKCGETKFKVKYASKASKYSFVALETSGVSLDV